MNETLETGRSDAPERTATAERTDTDGVGSADRESTADDAGPERTTVRVKCTGHVREAVGTPRMEYTFEGSTLRAFLSAFFEEYDVADLLIAETDAEASTAGWADPPSELPGDWRKNPEGERTRAYARVTVNGRFNENLDGLDTELAEGDRVALMYPFIFCC